MKGCLIAPLVWLMEAVYRFFVWFGDIMSPKEEPDDGT
jgi:hypothetical protein